jgi:Tat protein secretion system quality control protein TatD with DNase activity
MEDILAIKGTFRNTKFGTSPLLLMPNKYLDFKVDLCELRLGDMILESDAPYLHPRDYQEASPMLIKGNAPRIRSLIQNNDRRGGRGYAS